MISKNNTALVAIAILSLFISGCARNQTSVPTLTISPVTATAVILPTDTVAPTPTQTATVVPTPTRTATVTPIPFPAFTLKPGDFYFSFDGQPGFIFSRSMAGFQQTDYEKFLVWTRAGGSRLVRIQLDNLGQGYTGTGGVDDAWARQWERIFDLAAADGLYILPVFSGWFDWNAGSGFSTWKDNPLNKANGGPVTSPAELFQKGSATQTTWIEWMQTLVKRWQGRRNIAAWEIFSEVNIATGPTESGGIDFVNSAASAIRASDPAQRPVTASLAGYDGWPSFYGKASVDFINFHPYPLDCKLDRFIVSKVRQFLTTYQKPVLIGESSLCAAFPEGYPSTELANVGVRHAIWAGLVSGAMNGRSLYWEDSFGVYFSNLSYPFVQSFADADLPASKFVQGVDFSGFKPLTSNSSSDIWGAAVGNEKMVVGWYRDAASEPPDWKIKPIISKQTVTITIPGTAATWHIEFYDTKTGTNIVSFAVVTWKGNQLSITLPDFKEDIAFKAFVQQ